MAHGHADTAENHEKRERNARVGKRYDQLNREGKSGHYETIFRIVREEVERERERCARIADNFSNAGPHDIAEHPQIGAFQREIGMAIRTPD